MSSLWRRRRRRRGSGDDQEGIKSATELTVPTHFRCPISLDLMKDPVSLATGITYDREFIEKWLDTGHVTCPVTKQVLRNLDQIPNHALRKMIQHWCVENKSYGVERIPTPSVPITPFEVSEICSRMAAAARGHDGDTCQELVAKVKNWGRESDRNKRCLVSHGLGAALAETFEAFARFSMEKHANLLEETLRSLTWSFPLGGDGVSKLRSSASLRCMAWFLKGEDLSTRRDAVFVLRMIISGDDDDDDDDEGCVVDGLMEEEEEEEEVQGIVEALFQMVKVPICPKATQACLVVMHHMISKRAIISSRFVEMGLVDLAVEILVDGSKSICEKALGVLDEMCDSEGGRGRACGNALTIPILVKKLLRVSNAATEFCVSILWKVCVGGDEEAPIRALQFGGFQKVLVVLQIGCGEGTKEKGSELLRVMNVFRDKVECFDSSMPFKFVPTSSN